MSVDGKLTVKSAAFSIMVKVWRESRTATIKTGFPDIRWHQTYDYGYVPNSDLPKVFMAVAIDLPDFQSPYNRYVGF